jgi:hypothetical protein
LLVVAQVVADQLLLVVVAQVDIELALAQQVVEVVLNLLYL